GDRRESPSGPPRRSSDLGRSRHDWIHVEYASQMIVSLVGLTIRFSSRADDGAGRSSPVSASTSSRECVTTAHSFANPSTCCASRSEEHTSELQSRQNLVC